jgi:hypothetical protein
MLKVVKNGVAVVVANKINDAATSGNQVTWSVDKIIKHVADELALALAGVGGGTGGGITLQQVRDAISAALVGYETELGAAGKYVTQSVYTLFETLILSAIGISPTGDKDSGDPAFNTANAGKSVWVKFSELEGVISGMGTGIDAANTVTIAGAYDGATAAADIKATSEFLAVTPGNLFYVNSDNGTKLSLWSKVDDSTDPSFVFVMGTDLSEYAKKAYVDEKTVVDGDTIIGLGSTANKFKVATPVRIVTNAEFNAMVLVNGDTSKDGLYAITDEPNAVTP